MQILDLIRMVLFTLLIIAAISKWTSMKSFRRTLSGLNLPSPFVRLGAWLIPLFELIIGIGYLSQTTLLGSVTAFMCLSIAFLWANYTGQKTGVRCQCFGNLSNERFGIISYIRTLLLITLNLVLLVNSADISNHIAFNNFHELAAVAFLSLGFLLVLSLLNIQLEYHKRKSEM
ncbi:MauE/DoxX family redox-associated membrane protein [Fontibacillus sp. BL9]|uniref:MauE/DoxX family redox-associated membrane protein n=1 Tax=Fontibacillus sp. BL9 TaxID=3389971 RepID=UPI00397E873B